MNHSGIIRLVYRENSTRSRPEPLPARPRAIQQVAHRADIDIHSFIGRKSEMSAVAFSDCVAPLHYVSRIRPGAESRIHVFIE